MALVRLGGCLMITITDFAAEKVKELIEAEGEADLALRVAVRPGGCSGYSYEMFLIARQKLTTCRNSSARCEWFPIR